MQSSFPNTDVGPHKIPVRDDTRGSERVSDFPGFTQLVLPAWVYPALSLCSLYFIQPAEASLSGIPRVEFPECVFIFLFSFPSSALLPPVLVPWHNLPSVLPSCCQHSGSSSGTSPSFKLLYMVVTLFRPPAYPFLCSWRKKKMPLLP